jgi:hypothetical protein
MMKRLGKWGCACHLLAPALFWLGPALPAGDAVAQGAPSQIAQSFARNDSTAAEVRIWRTITLGTNSGVDAYREALDAARVKVGDSADEILGRTTFSYASIKTQVELALVSVAELGAEADAASRSDVYRWAKQIGLELCPAEVGPQLRLDYLDQPVGEALDIAMEPVATYSGDLTVLALVNFGSGLALIGGDGRSDAMVPGTRRFVFALPAKEHLEARRGPQ